MVDGSDSITSRDYQTLKSALVDLMDGLHLAEDQARFGVVLFSTDVAAEIPLSADRQQLRTRIMALQHPRDGTRTDLGTLHSESYFIRFFYFLLMGSMPPNGPISREIYLMFFRLFCCVVWWGGVGVNDGFFFADVRNNVDCI